jgi:hypothetical protein
MEEEFFPNSKGKKKIINPVKRPYKGLKGQESSLKRN